MKTSIGFGLELATNNWMSLAASFFYITLWAYIDTIYVGEALMIIITCMEFGLQILKLFFLYVFFGWVTHKKRICILFIFFIFGRQSVSRCLIRANTNGLALDERDREFIDLSGVPDYLQLVCNFFFVFEFRIFTLTRSFIKIPVYTRLKKSWKQ